MKSRLIKSEVLNLMSTEPCEHARFHLDRLPVVRIFTSSRLFTLTPDSMPCGRKRKRHKIATHKRKKRLRKNRHKKKAR